MPVSIEVLIPTCQRPHALALTLRSLAAQWYRSFRVIISDQSPPSRPTQCGELHAMLRYLEFSGCPVKMRSHFPPRGLAEQRHFLLQQSTAQQVLFLDDDLILDPDVLARLASALEREQCGFAGAAPIGLSYADDFRPDEEHIEFWNGPVQPEAVTPESAAWQRHTLHNAANLLHVQQRLRLTPGNYRTYKVAWVGGCVLYDRQRLIAAGGFEFWRRLPAQHCGEDVYAQLQVMARSGGCGVIPSGVYHQELPTMVIDRRVNAPEVLCPPAPSIQSTGTDARHEQ